jgi:hypothetical protein
MFWRLPHSYRLSSLVVSMPRKTLEKLARRQKQIIKEPNRHGHATFRAYLPPLTAEQWHLPMAGAKESGTFEGRRVLGAVNHKWAAL